MVSSCLISEIFFYASSAIFILSMNHSIRRSLTLLLCLHKVEDADDIQNVPATVGSGSDVKEEKSTDQDVKSEGGAQETSSINASELPPHVILGMPALSPTMVGKDEINQLMNMDWFCWIFSFPFKLNTLFYLFLQNQGNIAKWRKKEGDKVGFFRLNCFLSNWVMLIDQIIMPFHLPCLCA